MKEVQHTTKIPKRFEALFWVIVAGYAVVGTVTGAFVAWFFWNFFKILSMSV